MSRNWTPEEMLMVENNGTPIIEFMKGLSWMIDGKKIPMYSVEDIKICEQFTYLGKLLDGFAGLYKNVCKYQKGEEVLKRLEKELSDYIEAGCKGNKDSFVVQWFHGKLEPGFYYCEENNRLFKEKVLEEVNKKRRGPLQGKIESAKERTDQKNNCEIKPIERTL